MSFLEIFHNDEMVPHASVEPIASLEIMSGSYNGGLFSVLDGNLSKSVLSAWRWLLGEDAVALVATAIGDLFFWSERHGAVFFLEVQRGQSTFVDKEIESFLNKFLVKEGVKKSVLHSKLVSELSRRLGNTVYGKCFIAEPWLRLGGSGDPSTYAQGDLAVYLNLVGQSVEHAMREERAKAT